MNPFRQSSKTQEHSEMTFDKEALAALVDKSVSDSMQKSIDNLKETFEKSGKAQADSLLSALKGSVDEVLTTVLKKQDDHEAKVDQRFQEYEKKSDGKFLDVHNQLEAIRNSLCKTSPTPQAQQPEPAASLHKGDSSPHPSLLPHPTFAKAAQQPPIATVQEPGVGHEDTKKLKDIIQNARTIIGLGPITCDDIEDSPGNSDAEKLFNAVEDFIRCEIGVKESEIPRTDILQVFPAEDPDLERVYAQFRCKEQAELVMNLTRKLRKPDLKVILFVPPQMKQRFLALKSEDYRLRRLTTPRHKTRIEYSDEDILLYACPLGHFRFVHHPVQGLPPVDLQPSRTPPPGRKTKRVRSASKSPNYSDNKAMRINSPISDTVSDLDKTEQSTRGESHQSLN